MYIEELNKECDIDVNILKMIRKENGSLEAFGKKYIQSLSSGCHSKYKFPRAAEPYLVNYFDLSDPYSVGEYSGYAKLLMDMIGLKPGFVTLHPIESLIRETMYRVLDHFDIDLIKAYYRLDGVNKSNRQIAVENGLSEKELVQIRKRSVNRLGVSVKTSMMQLLNRYIIDGEEIKEYVKDGMLPEDAFCSKPGSAISDRKMQLVYSVMKGKIDRLSLQSNILYIYDALVIKNEIDRSILPDEKKQELIDLLDNKIHAIARENKAFIMQYYEIKIERAKQHADTKQARAILRDMKNSGLDDSEIEELSSNIPEELLQENIDYGQFRSNIMLKIGFPYLDTKVETLRLSKKIINALKTVGINSVRDLIELSPSELIKLGGMKRTEWQVVLDTIEHMGYDIPEDSGCPIIAYNNEKMKEDYLQVIAEEIQNAGYKETVKTYLLDTVLQVSIDRLKLEYETLEQFVHLHSEVMKEWTR